MTTLTPSVSEVNSDFRNLLDQIAYDEMVSFAASTHVENQVNNLPIPWQVTYNAYVQAFPAILVKLARKRPLPQKEQSYDNKI